MFFHKKGSAIVSDVKTVCFASLDMRDFSIYWISCTTFAIFNPPWAIKNCAVQYVTPTT